MSLTLKTKLTNVERQIIGRLYGQAQSLGKLWAKRVQDILTEDEFTELRNLILRYREQNVPFSSKSIRNPKHLKILEKIQMDSEAATLYRKITTIQKELKKFQDFIPPDFNVK